MNTNLLEIYNNYEGDLNLVASLVNNNNVSAQFLINAGTRIRINQLALFKGYAENSTPSLDDLSDVIITSPLLGEVLSYNGTNWVNSTGGGSISIVNVDDVSVKGNGTSIPLYSVSTLINYVATANINKYQPVTSNGILADSGVLSTRNRLIGLSNTNTLTGFSGNAIGFGQVENTLWSWNIGDRIFLNGNFLSVTAPTTGYSQMIGTAIASNRIDVNIQSSIRL